MSKKKKPELPAIELPDVDPKTDIETGQADQSKPKKRFTFYIDQDLGARLKKLIRERQYTTDPDASMGKALNEGLRWWLEKNE